MATGMISEPQLMIIELNGRNSFGMRSRSCTSSSSNSSTDTPPATMTPTCGRPARNWLITRLPTNTPIVAMKTSL